MTSQNNKRHKREFTNRNMLGQKKKLPRIDIHAQTPFYVTMDILYRLLFHRLSEIKIDV